MTIKRPLIYQSSKGPRLIADLPLPYLANALAKLRHEGDPTRAAEIEAMAARAAHVERAPYTPSQEEWGELYGMLCNYCDMQVRCEVVEGMIEMKDGGVWPEGGWVTDPGAGVTCLSYRPKTGQKVSRQHLRSLFKYGKNIPPLCHDCAAQRGSEAAASLHTRRDYAAAVKNRTLFECHERKGEPCGGWYRSITRRRPT